MSTTFAPRSIIFDTHDITIGCDDQNGSLFASLDGAIDDARGVDPPPGSDRCVRRPHL